MNGRRAKQRRRCQSDAQVATVAAWCQDETDLESARRQTHDTLLTLLGDQRRSGVRWTQNTGDGARELLGKLREGATGEHADYYRRLTAMLREYGGWIVVAMADGEMP